MKPVMMGLSIVVGAAALFLPTPSPAIGSEMCGQIFGPNWRVGTDAIPKDPYPELVIQNREEQIHLMLWKMAQSESRQIRNRAWTLIEEFRQETEIEDINNRWAGHGYKTSLARFVARLVHQHQAKFNLIEGPSAEAQIEQLHRYREIDFSKKQLTYLIDLWRQDPQMFLTLHQFTYTQASNGNSLVWLADRVVTIGNAHDFHDFRQLLQTEPYLNSDRDKKSLLIREALQKYPSGPAAALAARELIALQDPWTLKLIERHRTTGLSSADRASFGTELALARFLEVATEKLERPK